MRETQTTRGATREMAVGGSVYGVNPSDSGHIVSLTAEDSRGWALSTGETGRTLPTKLFTCFGADYGVDNGCCSLGFV